VSGKKRRRKKGRKPLSASPLSSKDSNKREETRRLERKLQTFIFLLIPVGIILAGVLLYFLFFSPTSSISRRRNLNLLLIIVDTLRADRLGYSGHKVQTPNIDRLAEEGTRFLNAISQYPMTLPSHVSLFTSTFPQYHGIKNNGNYYLGESYTTLAEMLKERGYLTSAFIGAVVLESKFGLAQGFDHYDDSFKTPEFLKSLEAQNLAEDVFESARSWFLKNHQQKFFMWVHFYDPHAPYTPPPPYDKIYPDPYDGEVAYTDLYVGKLVNMLEEKGLVGKTLIVFTSDHGEGLDEHDELTHGVFLYDTTLKVPLIFHCPRVIPRNKVIKSQVRIVDIMPTILDILDIEVPPSLQGKSLLPMMDKRASEGYDSYAETYFPYLSNGWSPLKCIRTTRYKYIEAPKPELYDLEADPGETRNILNEKLDLSQQLAKKLRTLETRYAAEKAPGKRILSSEEREKLRTLGYLEFFENKSISNSELPDPKENIFIFNQIQKAYDFFWKREPEKTKEILKKIYPLNPQNPGIHYIQARLHFREAKFREAIEESRKVLEVNNKHTDAIILLAMCYLNLNQPDNAIQELEKVPKIIPLDTESLGLISMAYRDKGNFEKALEYLHKAIKINEKNMRLRLQLAETLDLMKEDEKALKEFEYILKNDPTNARAHASLGIFYMNRGIFEKGIMFMERSIKLSPSPEIYYYLGFAYKKVGRKKEAEESFINFLRLSSPFDRERRKIAEEVLSTLR